MEGSSDPVYLTYYMMDWNKVKTSASEDRCVACGGPMLRVEPVTSNRGVAYEGRVCHDCKSLFWIKKD
jgi:uncharacterized protein with PIN domain